MPEPDRQSAPSPRPIVRLDRAGRGDGGDVAGRVGASLRQVFDEIAAEPLPQAFEDLLRKLA
jgi:hypothetical protein